MTSLLMLFITACNRDRLGDDEIQREEEIRSEDLREKDNYNHSIPSKSDGIEIERNKLNIMPDQSPVTN